MKKILILALAVVMCLTMLAGCGKSEEEKARDELQNALKEEMGEDAYNQLQDDLKDAADYEQSLQDKIENDTSLTPAELNALKESIYENEYAVMLNAYEAFVEAISSGSGEDVRKTANAYEEAATAVIDRFVAEGGETFVDSMRTKIRYDTKHHGAIHENELNALINYVENVRALPCEKFTIAYTVSSTDYYDYEVLDYYFFAYTDNSFESYVIKSDGTVIEIDLASITPEPPYMFKFDENCVIAEYNGYYSIDFTTNSLNVTFSEDEIDTSEYVRSFFTVNGGDISESMSNAFGNFN